MTLSRSVLLIAGLAVATLTAPTSGATQSRSHGDWFRGNTHAHTNRSDGSASPLEVARHYRDLGYDFLVISDHDQLTPIADLQRAVAPKGDFLLIPGEEVSASHSGRPIHLNGIGIERTVQPVDGPTVSEVIRANVAAIRAAGGIAQLNHPNYGWFLTAEEIAPTSIDLLEIMNPHPVNNSFGGGGWPSAEALWDDLLTRGLRVYGVAADDAHDYDPTAPRASDRGPLADATPGQAWIMVRAARLAAGDIIAALTRGDFYASTGIEFEEYVADGAAISIQLPRSYRYRVAVPGELRYRAEFIGADGRILETDDSIRPHYRFTGDEPYVRARIRASDGTMAWTQPLFAATGEPR